MPYDVADDAVYDAPTSWHRVLEVTPSEEFLGRLREDYPAAAKLLSWTQKQVLLPKHLREAFKQRELTDDVLAGLPRLYVTRQGPHAPNYQVIVPAKSWRLEEAASAGLVCWNLRHVQLYRLGYETPEDQRQGVGWGPVPLEVPGGTAWLLPVALTSSLHRWLGEHYPDWTSSPAVDEQT